MPEFPSLAQVIARHEQINGGFLWCCLCGTDFDSTNQSHAEHVAQQIQEAEREVCTISTVEQLDALARSVPAYKFDGIVIKDCYGHIYESSAGGNWTLLGGGWECTGQEVRLPALLLWRPPGGG